MIFKGLTQIGYTNRLIHTLLTVRLASACRTRNLRVAQIRILHLTAFKKKKRGYFPLSELKMSSLASLLKERAIFHRYCICKGKTLFCFMVEKQGIYSSHSRLKRAVSLHGFKNEAYFVYTALV